MRPRISQAGQHPHFTGGETEAPSWDPALLTLCPAICIGFVTSGQSRLDGRQVWMSGRVSDTGGGAWPSGKGEWAAADQRTHLETRAKASAQTGGQGTRRMARRPRALG